MPDSNFPSHSSSNGNGHSYSNGSSANKRNSQPPHYSYGGEDEIDLKHLFSILMRRKWAVIGITAIFAVGAYFYAQSQIPVYESQGTLLITDTQSNSWRAGAIYRPC